MKHEPSKRRQILSWCLFDFANSSFTTVIVTTVFSAWFTAEIARDKGETWGDALTLSNAIILVLSPIIGAIADRGSGKKAFLFASYLVCCAATAGLFFTGPGALVAAFSLFVVANVAFCAGESLVAGFLPDLATPEEMGRVSAWGWSVGYLGGLLSLGLCLPLAMQGGELALRATNLVVAVFFLVGGIPTFLWVREKPRGGLAPGAAQAVREGVVQVFRTFQERRKLPQLFRFFSSYLVFNIGVYGVISFASILAQDEFHLDRSTTIGVLIAAQVTAGIGAFGSGRGIARLGVIRFVSWTLVVWTLCGLCALLTRSLAGFWAVALLGGLAMGATLSSARAAVGILCPAEKSGEVFGLWGLFARLAAILAPAGNSLLLRGTHWGRAGVLFYTITFVVGWLLLRRVDEEQGLLEARRFSSRTDGGRAPA